MRKTPTFYSQRWWKNRSKIISIKEIWPACLPDNEEVFIITWLWILDRFQSIRLLEYNGLLMTTFVRHRRLFREIVQTNSSGVLHQASWHDWSQEAQLGRSAIEPNLPRIRHDALVKILENSSVRGWFFNINRAFEPTIHWVESVNYNSHYFRYQSSQCIYTSAFPVSFPATIFYLVKKSLYWSVCYLSGISHHVC